MVFERLNYLREQSQQKIEQLALKQAFDTDKDSLVPISTVEPEELEKVLLRQLGTLDSMFSRYSNALDTLLKSGSSAVMPEQIDSLANLVLKCQNQSVKTARALAELKKPRQTVFIKKQITQQLNQIMDRELPELKRIKETKNAPLDIGSEREAEPAYQAVEALEEVNRAKNRTRERA